MMANILEKIKLEEHNHQTIRLWPEGAFYKAYEHSAYLFVNETCAAEPAGCHLRGQEDNAPRGAAHGGPALDVRGQGAVPHDGRTAPASRLAVRHLHPPTGHHQQTTDGMVQIRDEKNEWKQQPQ